MTNFLRPEIMVRRNTLKSRYDVVIIGGGGHGLATAYYLAKRHGVRDIAVIERAYIGSGGTGRNTTIIRANYKTPETMAFYKKSYDMFRDLSLELDYNLLVTQRGLFWMAHSENQLRLQRERACLNQAFGINTVFLTPPEIQKLCPQLDMKGGGKYPILGAAYHPGGCISRHDAVVWAYAARAQELGVHIHQGVEVTGLTIHNGRCHGVETSFGQIEAGTVLSAVGGYVTTIAKMAGIRLPIVTHPLQAYVTEAYKPLINRIVASADLHIYISQSARGEVLIGAAIDPYTTYSTRSTFPFLASSASHAIDLIPALAKLRILRQWTGLCDMTPDYSPLMGVTEIEGFYLSTGWGTWGFKAIPASGLSMAELIATRRVPDLIAPFRIDRFRTDQAISERASAGTH